MTNRIAQAALAAILFWIALVRRGALLVVGIALALSVAASIYVFDHFAINTDVSDMLASDLPFRRLSSEVSRAFPQFSDNIVIVVDSYNQDQADAATTLLTERLRQRPELFGEVFDPAAMPFFQRAGFLYMNVAELEDLSDRLARAQPFLTSLWQDPSLRGLVDMLVLALEQTAGTEGADTAAPVLRQMATVVEGQAAGRFSQLSWDQVLRGKDEGDARNGRRIITISPRLDFDTLHPARAAMEAVHALAAGLALDPAHGVQVRMTGSAALSEEELQSLEGGIGTANAVSLALVAVLLVIGLTSTRLVVAVLATLLMGLSWTAAFALLAVGQFNLLSVAFAVLFIGLGVDFGIHVSLRYREGLARTKDQAKALAWAAETVGAPLTLAAAGAAIGFFSFLPTPYLGFAELGLIAGASMFIALCANLSVLPALLTLMPMRVSDARDDDTTAPGTTPPAAARFVARHARGIVWAALALATVSATALPFARFDFDPMHLRDPKTESVSTLMDLAKDKDTSPYSATVLSPSLAAADALAARLKPLPTVDAARTLSSYVPSDQDDKLDIVATMGTFLSPLFVPATKAPPTDVERKAALDALMRALESDRTAAAEQLLAALRRIDGNDPAVVRDLESRLLALLPQQLARLRQGLHAERVTLADLPEEIRVREVTADGRAKVTIIPTADLNDQQALRRFVRDVRTVTPAATGSAVTIFESGQAVIHSFRLAMGLTLGLLLAVLAPLLRNVREVLLCFAPLVLAALLTTAVSVLADIPFNFANVIALPLLFGIGIANGIQFVFRERLEHDPLLLLATSTPRAVIFSALTTMASFGSLALSTHPGTASMGMLLAIAITWTLVCTLVVLPALMATMPAHRSQGTARDQ